MLGVTSQMINFWSYAFVPLIWVIQKSLKNWLATVLPSYILAIYQNQRSTLIQQPSGLCNNSDRENRCCSETTGWGELFIL